MEIGGYAGLHAHQRHLVRCRGQHVLSEPLRGRHLQLLGAWAAKLKLKMKTFMAFLCLFHGFFDGFHMVFLWIHEVFTSFYILFELYGLGAQGARLATWICEVVEAHVAFAHHQQALLE